MINNQKKKWRGLFVFTAFSLPLGTDWNRTSLNEMIAGKLDGSFCFDRTQVDVNDTRLALSFNAITGADRTTIVDLLKMEVRLHFMELFPDANVDDQELSVYLHHSMVDDEYRKRQVRAEAAHGNPRYRSRPLATP